MKTTITVEIDIEATFTATKGYPATHEDPGCPDEIDDISFDHTEVIKAVETYLEDNKDEVEGILLEEAYEQKRAYEFERGEYLYEQQKDSKIEAHYNKGRE